MINTKCNDFKNDELKMQVRLFFKDAKNISSIMDFIDQTDFTKKEQYYCKIETLSIALSLHKFDNDHEIYEYFKQVINDLKVLVDNHRLSNEEKKDMSEYKFAMKNEFNDWSFLYQHAVFKYGLIQVQSGTYDCDDLLTIIDPLLDTSPGYYLPECMVLKGRIIKKFSVYEAREIFEKALQSYNSPDACAELAFLEMEQGNYDRAITLYSTLKSNNVFLIPYQKLTRLYLSRMYTKQKKYNLAEAELKEMLEKEYISKNCVYFELGKLYFAWGKCDEARKYYQQLLSDSVNDFDVISSACDLALLERENGNIDLALSYIEKAKQYCYDNYVRFIEAKVFLYANRVNEAYDTLWELVNNGSEKDRVLAADEILKYSYNTGDIETAKKALVYLKDSKNKNDRITYDLYTFLLYYIGVKTDQALGLAKRVYQERPSSMIVFKTIILDEVEKGNFDEVERLIREAEEKRDLNEYQLLSVRVLVYYMTNQIGLFNENFNKLLAADDELLAEPLYYLGRDLYHYDYNLGFKCFEKARLYESSFHNAINIFYAATFMPESEGQYQYKINLINALLSDNKIANDYISTGRLKISLLRTYISMGDYDCAKDIALEIMNLSTDQFFVNDAKLSLSIINRIDKNYSRSYELAKEVYESDYFAKHAYIQMVKTMYLINPKKAQELYENYSPELDHANLDYEYAAMLISDRKLDDALKILTSVKNNLPYRPYLIAKCNEKIEIINEIKKRGNIDSLDFNEEDEIIDYRLELK